MNLDEDVTQILDLMGPSFEKYYFVRSTREMQECASPIKSSIVAI